MADFEKVNITDFVCVEHFKAAIICKVSTKEGCFFAFAELYTNAINILTCRFYVFRCGCIYEFYSKITKSKAFLRNFLNYRNVFFVE
jgi:hypothetical protein